MGSLEDFPDEIILRILGEMSTKDFINTCYTNTRIWGICQDESLLGNRLDRDFPYNPAPPGVWKSTWYLMILRNIKRISNLSSYSIHKILLETPLIDLMTYSVSSRIKGVLNDTFWKARINRDFPRALHLVQNINTTYEQFYFKLLNDLTDYENVLFTGPDGRKTYNYTVEDIFKNITANEGVYLLRPGKNNFIADFLNSDRHIELMNSVSIFLYNVDRYMINYNSTCKILNRKIDIFSSKYIWLNTEQTKEFIKFLQSQGFLVYNTLITIDVDVDLLLNEGIIHRSQNSVTRTSPYASIEELMESITKG